MKGLLPYVVFASLAIPSFAFQSSCPAVPTLVVDDYVIEGTSAKGETLLGSGQIFLYARGKLVRRVTTDGDGLFTLDHLSPGVYRLSIQRLGNYDVKVVVTAVRRLPQRGNYFFGRTRNGCLNWGFNTN
jgi:hypothetical protein